ncbi:MAG: Holliday junction resolvase RuvX [bacterium]|nr:Holliday junction resolvase RuvX [bacterium]
MKILGIDYGLRKVGLAISEGQLASPLKIMPNSKDLEEKIFDLCRREEIGKIVVGISSGQMLPKQKKIGADLTAICGLPVEFWDETLTTKEAVRKMIEAGVKQKKRRREDAVSAALILQSFLDSKRKT